MKKSLKITSFLLVLLLFFLAGNKAEAASSIEYKSKDIPEKSSLKLNETSGTVCFSTRITTTIVASTSSINKAFKLYFCGLCPKIKHLEQSLKTTISRNSIFSKNGSIRFTQTDIIFPFHYFW